MSQSLDIGREYRQPLSQPRHYAGQTMAAEYRGQKVSFRADAASMVADAAEELSFQFGEKVAKKLAKRNIRKPAGRRTNALERAEFILKAWADQQDPHKRQAFAAALRDCQDPTPDNLQALARRFFEDPQEQQAALQAAYAQTVIDDRPEQAELRRALSLVQVAAPEPVQPTQRSEPLGLEREFEQVLRGDSFDAVTAAVLEHWPEEEVPHATAALIRDVGADLSAKGPALEPIEAKRWIDRLFHLEVLTHIFPICRDLPARIERGYGETMTAGGGAWLSALLALKENPRPNAEAVLQRVEHLGPRQPGAVIYLLRESLGLIRSLPHKAFAEPRRRGDLIHAFQQALDSVIATENTQTT